MTATTNNTVPPSSPAPTSLAAPANRMSVPPPGGGRAAPSPSPTPSARGKLTFGTIQPRGQSAVLYGGGGIGKTTLAMFAPGPVGLIDLEFSLPVLRPQLPEELDIRLIANVESWKDMRDALGADGWGDIKTIVIDSITKAEELCIAWVIKNVKHEKKEVVIERLEDYGWGRGLGHVYDEFLNFLADLDRHVRAGRNVILIAHDCTSTVPNPHGEDWLRYEPRLQAPASGKNSIRLKVREWADHVLFMGYDVNVKDGKGEGVGSRTVYPCELPHCMAKSRTTDVALPVGRNDASFWSNIIR